MTKGHTRFTVPIYTIAEASRFLGVPTSTFTTWAIGYVRRPPGRPPTVAGPIVTSFDAPRDYPRVPFIGLTEGMVVAAFRKAGVSMQHIRKAVAMLEAEIGLEHALASRKLYTDGARLLYDYSERAEDEELGNLTVVVSQQRVFAPVVAGYLERITYDEEGWPTLLGSPLTRAVVVDPKRSFGHPIFVRGAAPVEAVLDRFLGGDSLADVAEDFGVPEADVEDAMRATFALAA